MSYPPPHHGPYPPYLQQQPQQPQQPIQPPPQFLYNNVNPNHPYQYGKPVAYPPAMLPNFNAYAHALNQQQQPQQPQPHPQPQQQQQAPPQAPPQPSPRQHQHQHQHQHQQQHQHHQHPHSQPQPLSTAQTQYVNPADIFQQTPIAPPPMPSQFAAMAPSQYPGQSAVPIANNNANNENPNRSPVVSTAPGPMQSPIYGAHNNNQPNNTMYGQYPSHVASKPPLAPMLNNTTFNHAPTPSIASTPVAAPVQSAMPSASPSIPPPVTPRVPVQVSSSTPAPPTPSQKPVPQVIVPTPPPELQQKQPQPAQKVPVQQQDDQQAPRKQPGKQPIDYQVLLLSLADDYINAAHGYGTMAALSRGEMDVEEYYKLLATGLGCLEAVLKNWRLQPRMEALVRLRYSRILFEETDNDLEAETALSKGIDLCERNRMLDLKYSMQHLLARMLHKTNPKASLKAVDNMIQDVEAYRHSAWEYAFRFLRVSLSLSSPTHQDSVSAFHHLHKIASMANRNGDKAVVAISAMIEALAHLQLDSNFDSIEQAQRAVAIARSHQLNDELGHIPQLITMIQMVDICCSLLEYDVTQSSQKLGVLQELMDERLNHPNWRLDGSFSIPLNGKSAGPSSIDTGDILQVQNGTLLLSFSWLPQHDLYALCYFLSSITLSARNSYDGRKAEKFLQEGRRMINGGLQTPEPITESMVSANKRIEWRRTLYCAVLLQQVFLACTRTDWEFATQSLNELRQTAQGLNDALPMTVRCLMEYSAGTIAQATGDLKTALAIFQSPLLVLSPSSFSKTTRNDPCRDIAILSSLNSILILRDPAHPSHSLLPGIVSNVESFCKGTPNKYIQAAYFLVSATIQTESTIQTKQFLQQALQSATAISNNQITCMTLTFMSWKYFRGVVGEQAEKSSRAARAMAKKANDRLWVSVTDEMMAETLEKQGKTDEAMTVRDEGQRVTTGLPSMLKRAD